MEPVWSKKQCVVLAGGLGTRIAKRSNGLPKSLIPVHGDPFIHYQLKWLAEQEFDEVVLCTGFGADLIEEFVGKGDRWGLEVKYVREVEPLRGTGGALRLALEAGVLKEQFFTLYGDSYLPISLGDTTGMMNHFTKWQAANANFGPSGLMSVLLNQNKWDRSNVVYENGKVVSYDKRHDEPEKYHYIDYGLSILSRSAVARHIKPLEFKDLADVFQTLSEKGRLLGWEMKNRFFEIGSPEGLEGFENWVANQSTGEKHI